MQLQILIQNHRNDEAYILVKNTRNEKIFYFDNVNVELLRVTFNTIYDLHQQHNILIECSSKTNATDTIQLSMSRTCCMFCDLGSH